MSPSLWTTTSSTKVPLGVEHGGVVGLADLQLGGVVHAELLDGGEGAGSAKLDVAHVRDVEEADGGADGHVFGDEAGVLDGHVPAAEVDHLGLVGAVGGVEGGLAECGEGVGHAWILRLRFVQRGDCVRS